MKNENPMIEALKDMKFKSKKKLNKSYSPEYEKIINNYIEKQLKYKIEALIWILNNSETMKKYETFNYPEYCNMPENISFKLNPDFVDKIDENLPFIHINGNKKPTKKYINSLVELLIL
jgi:hypothetical protein